MSKDRLHTNERVDDSPSNALGDVAYKAEREHLRNLLPVNPDHYSQSILNRNSSEQANPNLVFDVGPHEENTLQNQRTIQHQLRAEQQTIRARMNEAISARQSQYEKLHNRIPRDNESRPGIDDRRRQGGIQLAALDEVSRGKRSSVQSDDVPAPEGVREGFATPGKILGAQEDLLYTNRTMETRVLKHDHSREFKRNYRRYYEDKRTQEEKLDRMNVASGDLLKTNNLNYNLPGNNRGAEPGAGGGGGGSLPGFRQGGKISVPGGFGVMPKDTIGNQLTNPNEMDRYNKPRQTVINLDSRDRDTVRYPNSNSFKINLGRQFRNVKRVVIQSTEFPNTDLIIREDPREALFERNRLLLKCGEVLNDANNHIYWYNAEDAIEDDIFECVFYTGDITPGNYVAVACECDQTTLAQQIEETLGQINRFSDGTPHQFIVDIDPQTNVVRILSVQSSGLALNPISTIAGTNVLTIEQTAHTFSVGDTVTLTNSSAVGGVTANTINGEHLIIATTANTYDIRVPQIASTTTTGGGANVLAGQNKPFKLAFSNIDTVGGILGFPQQDSSTQVATPIEFINTTPPDLSITPLMPSFPAGSLPAWIQITNHGFIPGDEILITETDTIPNIRGVQTVTKVIDDDNFEIGVPIKVVNNQITITNTVLGTFKRSVDTELSQITELTLSQTGNICVASPHNLVTNDCIFIGGVIGGLTKAPALDPINGIQVINEVLSSDKFTIDAGVSFEGDFGNAFIVKTEATGGVKGLIPIESIIPANNGRFCPPVIEDPCCAVELSTLFSGNDVPENVLFRNFATTPDINGVVSISTDAVFECGNLEVKTTRVAQSWTNTIGDIECVIPLISLGCPPDPDENYLIELTSIFVHVGNGELGSSAVLNIYEGDGVTGLPVVTSEATSLSKSLGIVFCIPNYPMRVGSVYTWELVTFGTSCYAICGNSSGVYPGGQAYDLDDSSTFVARSDFDYEFRVYASPGVKEIDYYSQTTGCFDTTTHICSVQSQIPNQSFIRSLDNELRCIVDAKIKSQGTYTFLERHNIDKGQNIYIRRTSGNPLTTEPFITPDITGLQSVLTVPSASEFDTGTAIISSTYSSSELFGNIAIVPTDLSTPIAIQDISLSGNCVILDSCQHGISGNSTLVYIAKTIITPDINGCQYVDAINEDQLKISMDANVIANVIVSNCVVQTTTGELVIPAFKVGDVGNVGNAAVITSVCPELIPVDITPQNDGLIFSPNDFQGGECLYFLNDTNLNENATNELKENIYTVSTTNLTPAQFQLENAPICSIGSLFGAEVAPQDVLIFCDPNEQLQPFCVPEGVYFIDVCMAGGGGGQGYNAINSTKPITTLNGFTGPGGNGALVFSTISVTPGDVLYISVGGGGSGGSSFSPSGIPGGGGANGGGSGYIEPSQPDQAGSGGGGGASDIRLGGTDLSDRIVVAAGGGGGGGHFGVSDVQTGPRIINENLSVGGLLLDPLDPTKIGRGGDGGGLNGLAAIDVCTDIPPGNITSPGIAIGGSGGTQFSGGIGVFSGSLGQGANAISTITQSVELDVTIVLDPIDFPTGNVNSNLAGTGFLYASSVDQLGVWFNVDGSGTLPPEFAAYNASFVSSSSRFSLVDLDTGDTPTDVATKIAAQAFGFDSFNISSSGNVVSFTAKEVENWGVPCGRIKDADAPYDTGFTITITQSGLGVRGTGGGGGGYYGGGSGQATGCEYDIDRFGDWKILSSGGGGGSSLVPLGGSVIDGAGGKGGDFITVDGQNGFVLLKLNSNRACFSVPGSIEYKIPNDATSLRIELDGAGGSAAGLNLADSFGGNGGFVAANVNLSGGLISPGDTLQINVGGGAIREIGGENGGGNGARFSPFPSLNYNGGGGGSSDVRVAPYTLNDRIIVAAGGGGAGRFTGFRGGDGGGLTGNIGVGAAVPGTGGSQITGGIIGGGFGIGGSGNATFGGAGGGGGWYGGGRGFGPQQIDSGGGGSSFTNPEPAFLDQHTVENISGGGSSGGGLAGGNGLVKIYVTRSITGSVPQGHFIKVPCGDSFNTIEIVDPKTNGVLCSSIDHSFPILANTCIFLGDGNYNDIDVIKLQDVLANAQPFTTPAPVYSTTKFQTDIIINPEDLEIGGFPLGNNKVDPISTSDQRYPGINGLGWLIASDCEIIDVIDINRDSNGTLSPVKDELAIGDTVWLESIHPTTPDITGEHTVSYVDVGNDPPQFFELDGVILTDIDGPIANGNIWCFRTVGDLDGNTDVCVTINEISEGACPTRIRATNHNLPVGEFVNLFIQDTQTTPNINSVEGSVIINNIIEGVLVIDEDEIELPVVNANGMSLCVDSVFNANILFVENSGKVSKEILSTNCGTAMFTADPMNGVTIVTTPSRPSLSDKVMIPIVNSTPITAGASQVQTDLSGFPFGTLPFVNGDLVTISGHIGGDPHLNCDYKVFNVTGNTFSVQAGTTALSTGGIGGFVTGPGMITVPGHGLFDGDKVQFRGGLTVPDINAPSSWPITVLSPTEFTIPIVIESSRNDRCAPATWCSNVIRMDIRDHGLIDGDKFFLYNATNTGGVLGDDLNTFHGDKRRNVPTRIEEETTKIVRVIDDNTIEFRINSFPFARGIGGGFTLCISANNHTIEEQRPISEGGLGLKNYGFNAIQTNMDCLGSVTNFIDLNNESYVLLTSDRLNHILNTGPVGEIFAKIQLSSSPGDVAYNSFVSTERVFDNPIVKFEEVDFEIRRRDGRLFDLRGRNWSISLLVEEYQDRLRNAEISSRRGIPDRGAVSAQGFIESTISAENPQQNVLSPTQFAQTTNLTQRVK